MSGDAGELLLRIVGEAGFLLSSTGFEPNDS